MANLSDIIAGGGVPAVPLSIFDAAGDIVQGTGANTAARLAIGTAGQILRVNSGATALEYTGRVYQSTVTSMAQNATTNITGTTVVAAYELAAGTDQATTGNSISGGDYAGVYGKDKAFDNDTGTRWVSSQMDAATANTAYIGQSGLTTKVTAIAITNTNFTDTHANFKVQHSANGTDWTDIDTVTATKTANTVWTVTLSDYTPAATYYLRMLATEGVTGGNGWSFAELAFNAAIITILMPVTDYLVTRPAATGSQTLTVKRLKAGSLNTTIDYI